MQVLYWFFFFHQQMINKLKRLIMLLNFVLLSSFTFYDLNAIKLCYFVIFVNTCTFHNLAVRLSLCNIPHLPTHRISTSLEYSENRTILQLYGGGLNHTFLKLNKFMYTFFFYLKPQMPKYVISLFVNNPGHDKNVLNILFLKFYTMRSSNFDFNSVSVSRQ